MPQTRSKGATALQNAGRAARAATRAERAKKAAQQAKKGAQAAAKKSNKSSKQAEAESERAEEVADQVSKENKANKQKVQKLEKKVNDLQKELQEVERKQDYDDDLTDDEGEFRPANKGSKGSNHIKAQHGSKMSRFEKEQLKENEKEKEEEGKNRRYGGPDDKKWLKRPAIARLALLGGVHRLSAEAVKAYRRLAHQYLHNVMYYALQIAHTAKRTSITPTDIAFALQRQRGAARMLGGVHQVMR